MIEFGAFGLKLAQAIGPKLAEIGFKEAIKKFNPSDFEKACTCGIEAARIKMNYSLLVANRVSSKIFLKVS